LDYLITGCTRINAINFPDGRTVKGFLGGALFAVNGIKPFSDDVLLITTAGPDFDNYYGNYFRENQLSKTGIQFNLPKTEYTILDYTPDGRWWEYSKYGEDFEQSWAREALIKAEFVSKYADQTTRGIYFESAVREPLWQNLDEIRAAAPNAKIMWELSTGDCENPQVKDAVLALIGKLDMYSVNLPEAMHLFGTQSEAESIRVIQAVGKPCFFRVGERGAYLIDEKGAWFAPAIDTHLSVDATGCGNCSTGTALFGFCEGYHPLLTVIMANLAASLNAQQYGPYPKFTAELREQLNQRAQQIFNQLIME
jgi:sugar/nucleoside kinase (ribokinase family)